MNVGDKYYLEASQLDRARAWFKPSRRRSAARGHDLSEDRIIVRRRRRPMRAPLPEWLVRSALTTVVIAVIGFTLQFLFMPSYAGANGSAAANRWPAIAPGAGGAGLPPGSLALAVLAPEQQALQPISRQAAIALNDAIPFSTGPIPAATPFTLTAAAEPDRDRAVGCLARAIYYEAGGDTIDDQRAVAQVVLNRVRHPLFPKTVCGVVLQGSQLRTGCQFTFTCDGSMSRAPEPRAWARAQALASDALNGAVYAPVGYATHFHTPWVAPYWAPTLEKVAQVGGHLFYRWPGGAGAPRAFTARYAGGEMASASEGGGPQTPAPVPALAAAPSTPSDAPASEPRKIAVASLDLPAATATLDRQAPLVVAPPSIVLAVGPSLAVRSYHPPIPRGGLAQPLLSRDR
jgi:spore germination cell wall hydrolase CwlJ-like protein